MSDLQNGIYIVIEGEFYFLNSLEKAAASTIKASINHEVVNHAEAVDTNDEQEDEVAEVVNVNDDSEVVNHAEAVDTNDEQEDLSFLEQNQDDYFEEPEVEKAEDDESDLGFLFNNDEEEDATQTLVDLGIMDEESDEEESFGWDNI